MRVGRCASASRAYIQTTELVLLTLPGGLGSRTRLWGAIVDRFLYFPPIFVVCIFLFFYFGSVPFCLFEASVGAAAQLITERVSGCVFFVSNAYELGLFVFTHARTQTHTYTRAPVRTPARTHTHTQTHARTHARTHAHKHTHNTHTHTLTHTHIHTHTHTHTHT